jgi:hypothetical protein
MTILLFQGKSGSSLTLYDILTPLLSSVGIEPISFLYFSYMFNYQQRYPTLVTSYMSLLTQC